MVLTPRQEIWALQEELLQWNGYHGTWMVVSIGSCDAGHGRKKFVAGTKFLRHEKFSACLGDAGNLHQCPHTTVLQFDAFLDQLTTKQRVAIFCTTDLSTIKRKKRSNLEVMALSEDFSLLPDLQIHSVVLRIASTGLCMCLHYDVCDNFRCCIRGCKRVVLLSLSSS